MSHKLRASFVSTLALSAGLSVMPPAEAAANNVGGIVGIISSQSMRNNNSDSGSSNPRVNAAVRLAAAATSPGPMGGTIPDVKAAQARSAAMPEEEEFCSRECQEFLANCLYTVTGLGVGLLFYITYTGKDLTITWESSASKKQRQNKPGPKP